MKLQTSILYLSIIFVCSAYRLNHRLEQRKFEDSWVDAEEDPEYAAFYREFG